MNDIMNEEMLVSKTVAPEDLRVGLDVTILHYLRENPGVYGMFGVPCEDPTPVRWTERPRRPVPPLRVVGFCLPFVLVEDPLGSPLTLDVRAVRLVRLGESFAALVRERFRAEAARRKAESGEGAPSGGVGGGMPGGGFGEAPFGGGSCDGDPDDDDDLCPDPD
jgi:hypothetical protein